MVGKLIREGSFKVPKLTNELELYSGKPKRKRGPRQNIGLDVATIQEDITGEKSTDRYKIGKLEENKNTSKMNAAINKINTKDYGLKK